MSPWSPLVSLGRIHPPPCIGEVFCSGITQSGEDNFVATDETTAVDGSLGIMYGVVFTVCEGSWDSGSCVPNLFVVVSLSWMVDTLDDGYERNINIYR